MKKLHFISALMAVTLLCLINSCSKDDEEFDEDVKTENLSSQDPEGTIILNMTSGSDGNYYKIGELGKVHLDAANNFRGKNLGSGYYKIEFVNIGRVDGLSKITQIPVTGWSESAAVVPGTGYVMRYTPAQWEGGNVIYTRIYVVDYLTTATTDEFGITTGSNSGAIIKYQTPFYGSEEEIKLDETSLTFDAHGGSQTLVLNNKNVLFFEATSSESWCTVSKLALSSSFENAITIYVSQSDRPEARTAVVTLTTAYDKSVTITITQSGAEPYIYVTNKEVGISGEATSREIGISTNYSIGDIEISGGTDWCQAYLIDQTYAMQEKAAKVKPMTRSDDDFAAHSYQLLLSISANDGDSRSANITLTSKDKKAKETIVVLQDGASIVLGQSSLNVDASASTEYVDLSASFDVSNLIVECDSYWCNAFIDSYDYYDYYTSYTLRNRLVINHNQNFSSKQRTAIIKISSKSGKLSKSLNVTQNGDIITIRNSSSNTIDAGKRTIDFYYNCYAGKDSLCVTSDSKWCTPTIYDGFVRVEAESNPSDVARTAIIKLSHKNEEDGAQYTIIQNGIVLTMPDTVWYDKNQHTSEPITLQANVSAFDGFEVESSEEWCKPSINGSKLTIRVSATTIDREAIIRFKGITKNIKVVQSKYAVGDEYSEGPLTGTVGYMKDNQRYIYKIVGTAEWSKENVDVGATDHNNGMNNMIVIKKLPDWEEMYPAFALCEALNVDGENGWYLPSVQEANNLQLQSEVYWTSTESGANRAFISNYANYAKSQEYNVVALHKF